MRQFAVHTLTRVSQMRQFAEVAVYYSPRTGAEWVANAAGHHIEPPPSRLGVVCFGVALHPCHQVGCAALLQPSQPRVIINLSHRPPGVLGHLGRAELNGAPGVDQPAVSIVQGFNPAAGKRGPSQQHSSRSGKRFDIARGVAKCLPDARGGSALAAKVWERCSNHHATSSRTLAFPLRRLRAAMTCRAQPAGFFMLRRRPMAISSSRVCALACSRLRSTCCTS